MNAVKKCLWACLAIGAIGASRVHAITLGGTVVAKDKMVVYLMIGHSNMVGQDLAHSDNVSNPKVWNYLWNGTKTWVLAKEPPNTPKSGLSTHGCGGPGMPFLKGMAAAYPDYYFGVLSNASLSSTCRGLNTGNNSSGLDPSDNRYWKGSYLYTQLLASAKEIQPDVTFGGIICMLGTVDATRTDEATCRNFSTDITQLVTDLRADLGMPNLPYIMGEYEAGATGSFAPTLLMPGIIQSEIKLIPGKLSLSATVDSKGIQMLDDHHYQSTPQGQGEWANRVVAILKAKAWFPPPAATVIESAGINGARANMSGNRLLTEDGEKLISDGKGLWLVNGGKAPADIRLKAVVKGPLW
jgi:hypothetical protein